MATLPSEPFITIVREISQVEFFLSQIDASICIINFTAYGDDFNLIIRSNIATNPNIDVNEKKNVSKISIIQKCYTNELNTINKVFINTQGKHCL